MRTILFVDDHPVFRDGLRRTLEADIADLDVVTVGDAASALNLLESGRDVDLLLTDYRLPDRDGLALLADARRSFPTVGAGLLCGDLSPALLREARALGAILCLSKARAPADIVAAVRDVFQGGQAFERTSGDCEANRMSSRRREILALASRGHPDKVIGARLGVSENTIRNHWKYIFEQLSVNSRTEAVGKAIRRGMI
ncbi:MAG TPA: response regulator transcription factor [Rhodoblastus sp.]|nr:response regulator transcription factor [Rhodoblastus sp.]